MERPQSKILLNDKPIQVGRHCARLLGLTEAAVLQTLHWHILEYSENAHRTAFVREYFYQGHWWYKGTYQQMVEGHKGDARGDFDFLPISTLRKTLTRLEERHLIITQEIASNGSREGKRYRIDHAVLNTFADAEIEVLPPSPPCLPLASEQGCLPLAAEQSLDSPVGEEKASVHFGHTLNTERVSKMDRHPAQSGQTRVSKMDRHPVQSGHTLPLKMECIESSSDSCKSHHQMNGAPTQPAPDRNPNDDEALFEYLRRHDVDPPAARRLVADGLTQAQAELAVASVQNRTGIRSFGAVLFMACKDAMAGKEWKSKPDSQEPRRKLSVKPMGAGQSVPPPVSAPPEGFVAATRAAMKSKRSE